MQREHQPHRARMPHRQQQQPGGGDEEQQREHRVFPALQLLRHRPRIGHGLHPGQPRRPDAQQHAAPGAELDRKAPEGMRRGPAEHMVIRGARAGRREAHHEAVEHGVMQPAAVLGEAVIDVVAAMPAAAEVPERQDIHGCIPRRLHPDGRATRCGAAPVADAAHDEGQDREAECAARQQVHQPQRNDAIEGARPGVRAPERRRILDRDRQHHRERGEQRGQQRHDGPVALEQPAHGRGPGEGRVAFLPQRREGGGHIHAEGVRGGVLAGVVAALAAMAEIGQVRQVARGEIPPHRHGGEDRAVAFAVAAGIADRHLPPRLGDRLGVFKHRRCHAGRLSCGHGARPPHPRCGRRRCRSPCRSRPDSPGPGCCPT